METVSYGPLYNRLRQGFSSPAAGNKKICPKGAAPIFNF